MDSITDEEKKVVEELRRRTINDATPKALEDESLFYRFAKARDFNIEEAEKMLRKHLAWRKDFEIDTILTDYRPTELLVKYGPASFVCLDKNGCVVRLHDCGRADLKGVSYAAKTKDILKYMVYSVELDRERVRNQPGNKRSQLGKPILSPIYDFDELSYAKAVNVKALQITGYVLSTFIDNYPEYLNTITVINAPFYFSWMYTALKPILPATVIQKVRIYGTEGWKEVLLETIDPEDLPAYLGGNRTDPDGNPLCETFIARGQTIPKSCYMQKGKKKLHLESNVEKLTLLPMSKEGITFTVNEENLYLEWEFETKHKDIDFSLFFRSESPEEIGPTELIPKQRIDTYYEPEKGCFKCEKVGKYTIVFDNSYSWFHSKEVYYRAGIRTAKNGELCYSS